MALLYGQGSTNHNERTIGALPTILNNSYGQPLLATEVWTSEYTDKKGNTGLEALKAWAKDPNATAYIGQKVVYIETVKNGSDTTYNVTHYSVDPSSTTGLKELGAKPVGDGKTIAVSETGIVGIFGASTADSLQIPRMNASKTEIEWVDIDEVVEGDTNTEYKFTEIKNGDEVIGFKVVEHTGIKDEDDKEITHEETFSFDFVKSSEFGTFKTAYNQKITTIEGNVSTISGKVSTLETDNATNKETISSHGTRLTDVEGKASTNETNIGTLTTKVSTAEGKISTLEGKVSTAETKISTLEGHATTYEGKVDTLVSDNTTNKTDIKTLKSTTETLETNLSGVTSRVGTAETDIAGLKTATAANTAAIGTAKEVNNDGEVTKAATGVYIAIDNEETRAKAAELALSGRITDLSNDITTNYATITYVNDQIAGITHFKTEIVESTNAVTKEGILYLIKDTNATGVDKYNEYLFVGGEVVLIGDTTTDLSNYVTNSALSTTLAAYYTKAEINTTLENYSTTSQVESKIATELSTFKTNIVDASLANYLQTKTFNDSIKDYAKAADVTSELTKYAKTEDVSKDIKDAKEAAALDAQGKIDDALKSYTTTSDLAGSYLKKADAQTTYITAQKAATDIETARQSAVDHTNEELKKYTTTSIIKETYATKTNLSDGVTEAKGYTDTKLADYAKTADVQSTYVAKTDYEAYKSQIEDGENKDKRLLKAEEITKLAKLELSGNDLTISGSVTADNVTGIEDKIRGVVTGATALNIKPGAEVNAIETISLNGSTNKLEIDSSRNVNIDLTGTYYNKEQINSSIKTLEDADTAIKGRLDTAESNISTLTANTQNNTNEITSLKNDLNGTTGENATAGIKARLSAVEAIAAEHITITGAINENTTAISELSEDLAEVTGIVNSHTTTLTGTDGNGGLVADVSGLKNTTADHAGRLTALETTDVNANNRLLAIEAKVGKAAEGENAAITGTLETAINGLDERLDTAEDEIDTLQTDLDTAEGAIEDLDERLGTVETTVAGHATRLTTAEGDIDALQAQVTTWAGNHVDGNGKADTQKTIRAIAAEEVADIVDGANEKFDTLKEIADWIGSDITGAASLNSAITENANAIGELQTGLSTANTNIAKNKSILDILVGGDISTTTPTKSITEMISDNKNYVDNNFVKKNSIADVATSSILGLVKGSNEENKISIASDGTMEVNSLNVNKLTQTEGDTFILCGGDAGASSQNA